MAMASILPTLIPLRRVAKELGKSTHVLVSASAAGTFPPVVCVGAMWFVKAALLHEWFDQQHAESVTPAHLERMRQAARDEAGAPLSPRPPRPRAT